MAKSGAGVPPLAVEKVKFKVLPNGNTPDDLEKKPSEDVESIDWLDAKDGEKAPTGAEALAVGETIAGIINGLRKFLTGNSAEAKEMRIAYLPFLHDHFNPKARPEDDGILRDFFDYAWPKFSLKYYGNDDLTTFGITNPNFCGSATISLNGYLCDAYFALLKEKNAQADALKFLIIVTLYHELGHALFAWAMHETTPRYFSIEGMVISTLEGPHLPKENGESGRVVEFKIMGGCADIADPNFLRKQMTLRDYGVALFKRVLPLQFTHYSKTKAGLIHIDQYKIGPAGVARQLHIPYKLVPFDLNNKAEVEHDHGYDVGIPPPAREKHATEVVTYDKTLKE